MAKTNEKLAWQTIDAEALPKAAQNAYATYKADAKVARESKERFEDMVRDSADVPKGKRLVFAYNFGKLSVALADEGEAKPKPKPTQTLADYLRTAR